MNQHGAPSTASPHRVKLAVAAKQRRLNTSCNRRLLKDFTFGLASNFFSYVAGTIYLGRWMLLSPSYPSRIENTNFAGAKFRAARFSLRFYDHWCPDVSCIIKLARFPIGHPNATV